MGEVVIGSRRAYQRLPQQVIRLVILLVDHRIDRLKGKTLTQRRCGLQGPGDPSPATHPPPRLNDALHRAGQPLPAMWRPHCAAIVLKTAGSHPTVRCSFAASRRRYLQTRDQSQGRFHCSFRLQVEHLNTGIPTAVFPVLVQLVAGEPCGEQLHYLAVRRHARQMCHLLLDE